MSRSPHGSPPSLKVTARCGLALLISAVCCHIPAAKANEQQALLQMAAGRSACKTGRHAEGVRELLDGAVALQRANPAHPANHRWLPQVRRCLRAWIHAVDRQCRRQGKATALDALGRIQKTMRYLSAPIAKRLIKGARRRCLGSVVRVQARQCMEAPSRAGLLALGALAQTLRKHGATSRLLGRLSRGRDRCARRWVQDMESRCSTSPQVSTLRQMGQGVTILPGKTRRVARTAYVHCAQALARTAWALCRARQYLKGYARLKEAIDRYGFFGVEDRAFLRTARTKWLPRCGTWRISGYFVARATARKVRLRVEARLAYVLARTGRARGSLAGELRVQYSALRGRRRGCRVLLTPQDGRYPLRGRETGPASSRRIQLQREPALPAIPAVEELQVACGAAAADITKLRLMDKLVKAAGLLAPALKARPGSRRTIRYRGALPGGMKASLAGTFVVSRIDTASPGQRPARRSR